LPSPRHPPLAPRAPIGDPPPGQVMARCRPRRTRPRSLLRAPTAPTGSWRESAEVLGIQPPEVLLQLFGAESAGGPLVGGQLAAGLEIRRFRDLDRVLVEELVARVDGGPQPERDRD